MPSSSILFIGGSSATSSQSTNYTWSWNFGDGSTGTGRKVSHQYSALGHYTATLTVTDGNGGSASPTASVVIGEPPTANTGGPYSGTAGTAIRLDGSASSDPQGEALTYAWNFGDGSTGTGAKVNHAYSAGGTYTATLTVTNADGFTNSSTAQVSVTASPTANPDGPYTGTVGTAVSFASQDSSDPKGETLTYSWNFGDGSSGTGRKVQHTYSAANTYTVTLTVTDTDGLSGSGTTTAAITAPSLPVDTGGPYASTTGTAITFVSHSTDPNGLPLTYTWNFGDGTTATGRKIQHTYSAANTYTVTLTLTDTRGATGTGTTTATVTAPSLSVDTGGPYTGTPGTAITFVSHSTDPNGLTLTYRWNFGDGTTGSGRKVPHTYAAAGKYTVTLTLSDSSGATGTGTTTASITSVNPPVANAGGPYTGTTSTAITFNGSGSSDPAGSALTYQWSFGDGAQATGVSPTHTYVTANTYTVGLTVTNASGVSASAQTTATITAPQAQPPVVTPAGPYNGLTSSAVTFNGQGSYDPANKAAGAGALTLSWNFGDGTQGTGPAPIHMYTTAGTYTVTLTGTTASGLSASASTMATITAGPPQSGNPIANANGPYTGQIGTPVSFSSAGSSDPNNLALSYIWAFGDGTSSNDPNPTHTYTYSGTFSVSLTVSNGTTVGSTLGFGSSTVTIAPAVGPPALVANAGGPYSVAVNQPIQFNAAGTTDPSNRQLTYTWDFGDGTTGTGVAPVHVYATSGSYTASLNVQDGLTGNGNATAAVIVTGPAAEAINASAGGPYSETAGRAVVLDATGTADNLGNSLTYSWNFGDGTTGTGPMPSHTYSAPGSYTASITATSSSGMTATASASVKITQAIAVTITSPTSNALFGANAPVTVTGTLSIPGLSVAVNGVAATVSGTSFTAAGVTLREGVNLITATATDGNGGAGNGVVSVLMDATAPTASITSPAANATLTNANVTVTGLINDIVTGTVGSNDVTVTVNGQPAQVNNRSYMISGVVLVPGANTITVVATDKVGNKSTTSETVQVLPPNAALSLNVVSGDGQTAVVHNVLTQPLVVQLLSAAGVPVAGRPITFTVTRSDGQVEVLPNTGQALYVNSDASGKASVLFQVGSRSGLGINQVTASTPGAAGTAVFTANSTLGAPAQIHSVRGDNQRGLLGEPLPEAFQVIVQDAYSNPVPGASVTFTSTGASDGSLSASTVTTDSNGKATDTLTLGQQEGVNNYQVQANIATNTGTPVTYLASAYAQGPVANTSVSGIVQDNSGTAVPNATVTLANTGLSTTTDTNGRFKITGAPVGTVTLTVDGSTSTSTHTFPFLSFVLQDLPGQDNTLIKPIFLPFIDVDDAQTVGGDDPVTLTIAGVPGVAFTIAPHSVTFPDGSTVGKMSLSQVKSDMVPMLPSNGTGPNLIWTLQPAGTRFSTPVVVTLPNTQGLAPGSVSEFFQYDHDLEQFVSAGTMHVSADGSVMTSDPGFGITKAGWGHGAVFAVPPACVFSCKSTNPCITATRATCNCILTYNDGLACGNTNVDQCHNPGECLKGNCVPYTGVATKVDGTPCTGPLFCPTYACAGGECAGTPQKDKPLPAMGNPQVNTVETAVNNVGDTLKNFFDKIGGGVELQPYFDVNLSNTLGCCEATKNRNSETDKTTLTVGLKINSPEFTVVVGAVPLGIILPPPFGTQGLTLQIQGSIAGEADKLTTDCPPIKNCWDGGPSVGVGAEGKVRLGIDAAKFYGSVSGGVTGTLKFGCGQVNSSITWSGIKITGGVTLANFFSVPLNLTLLGPTTFSTSYDTTTGAITSGIQ